MRKKDETQTDNKSVQREERKEETYNAYHNMRKRRRDNNIGGEGVMRHRGGHCDVVGQSGTAWLRLCPLLHAFVKWSSRCDWCVLLCLIIVIWSASMHTQLLTNMVEANKDNALGEGNKVVVHMDHHRHWRRLGWDVSTMCLCCNLHHTRLVVMKPLELRNCFLGLLVCSFSWHQRTTPSTPKDKSVKERMRHIERTRTFH